MFPLMLDTKPDFYTTLFIFMIDRVIDLIFERSFSFFNKFFYVWSTINLVFGILICSMTLALLSSTFRDIMCLWNIMKVMHYVIFAVALSYLMKDFLLLLYIRRKEMKIISDIGICWSGLI